MACAAGCIHALWFPKNVELPWACIATTAQDCGTAGFVPDGSGLPTGTPLADPPLVEMLSEDPLLRNTKLIAEAWDCDGLNQVSHATSLALSDGTVDAQLRPQCRKLCVVYLSLLPSA